MSRLLLCMLSLLVVATSFVAYGQASPPPQDPVPVAKQVRGKWTPNSSAYRRYSQDQLEELQSRQAYDIQQMLDTVDWEAPAPQSIADAIWHLKNKTSAGEILFSSSDPILFGTANPKTANAALLFLAQKAHDLQLQIDALDVRIDALENP